MRGIGCLGLTGMYLCPAAAKKGLEAPEGWKERLRGSVHEGKGWDDLDRETQEFLIEDLTRGKGL